MALVRSPRRTLVALAVAALAVPAAATGAPAHEGPAIEAHVVGGAAAPAGTWPSIVALVPAGADAAANGVSCGGTLITPTAVLTAAHCVVGDDGLTPLPPSATEVIAGTSDLALPGDRIPVAGVRVHPAYRAPGEGPDVAVLTLARPSAAPVATMARPGQDPDADRPAEIAGWGARSEADVLGSPTLLTAPVTAFSSGRCERMLGTSYGRGLAICAGRAEGGVDTCTGDSGGPLRDGAGLLIGITSWGSGCGRPGRPGVYTRVTAVAAWVDGVLAAPTVTGGIAAAPVRTARSAPRVVALDGRARKGGAARLRYRLFGAGETTRESIVIRAGKRVVARLHTDAGPARADLEYSVRWTVPRALHGRDLRFCVSTKVVKGPGGRPDCAVINLVGR